MIHVLLEEKRKAEKMLELAQQRAASIDETVDPIGAIAARELVADMTAQLGLAEACIDDRLASVEMRN